MDNLYNDDEQLLIVEYQDSTYNNPTIAPYTDVSLPSTTTPGDDIFEKGGKSVGSEANYTGTDKYKRSQDEMTGDGNTNMGFWDRLLSSAFPSYYPRYPNAQPSSFFSNILPRRSATAGASGNAAYYANQQDLWNWVKVIGLIALVVFGLSLIARK